MKAKRSANLAFLLLLAVAVPSLVGSAVAMADDLVTDAANPSDDTLDLAESMFRSGDIEGAKNLLAIYKSPTSEAQLRLGYLAAMIVKEEGDHATAVRLFREILSARPDLQRVRFNLAHTLFLLKEDEGARHHFELVRAASDDPQLRDAINRFVRAMDQRKRWTGSAYLSLAPSSNINQGTDHTEVIIAGLPFVINEESRAKSGIGIAAGGTLGFRHTLAPDLDIEATARVNARRYREETFNDTQAAFSVGPRWYFDRGNMALKGFAERRWSADEALSVALGGRAESRIRLGGPLTTSVSAGCYHTSHETDWFGTDLSNRDGHACELDLALDISTGSDSFVRLLMGGEEEWSETPRYAYGEQYFGVGVYRELPFGVTLYGEGRARRREYDEPTPLLGLPRDDRQLEAMLQVTKRDFEIFGVAPRVTYNFTKRFSNLDVYEYTSHGVDLSFTRAF